MRPYDDELVGSALSRATRDFGLTVPSLLVALTGRPLLNHSFVLTRYAGIAHAFGLSLEDFNHRHTTIGYSIAFMQPEQRQRMWRSTLVDDTPIAAIAQNLTRTGPSLRGK